MLRSLCDGESLVQPRPRPRLPRIPRVVALAAAAHPFCIRTGAGKSGRGRRLAQRTTSRWCVGDTTPCRRNRRSAAARSRRRSVPDWTTTSSHDAAPGSIATRECASWCRIARAIACASLRQRRCSTSLRWRARSRRGRAYASDATGSAAWRFCLSSEASVWSDGPSSLATGRKRKCSNRREEVLSLVSLRERLEEQRLAVLTGHVP